MAISGSVSPDAVRVRRCTVTIPGVVQGIGFRPSVYRMAMRHGLAGSVRNSLQGALVELEGNEAALERFLDQLQALAPNVDGDARCLVTWGEPRGALTLSIEESVRHGTASLHPVPDLGVCAACLGELVDPRDRRRGYPLLTCAGCGPRFTIVQSLPYDRERTTMTAFSMCARCRREYEDPDDRRFHAENIACADCGPRVGLHGPDGAVVAEPDAIGRAADALRAGGVIAVKGVGGYHLACDARNGGAVAALRRRKRREAKPLAVMVADILEARALCQVSDAEARLLASAARPIVLLARRASTGIAEEVAPGCRELGIILPYTPLHHLLLAAAGTPLVMTSGNASDEPIAHRDTDALTRLQGIADLLLTHDRPIHVRCDDSVARVVGRIPCLVRRSRGYVPLAVRLPVAARHPVLACGGELKSTFALVRDGEAFLSQHLGDLDERSARSAASSRRSATSSGCSSSPRKSSPTTSTRRIARRSTRSRSKAWSGWPSSITTPTSRAAWPTTGWTGPSSAWHGTAAATAPTATSGAASSSSRTWRGSSASGTLRAGAHAGWRGRGPRAVAHGGRLPACGIRRDDGDARPRLHAPAGSGRLARAESRRRPGTERAPDLERRPAVRRRGQPARSPRPRRLRGAGGDGARGARRARGRSPSTRRPSATGETIVVRTTDVVRGVVERSAARGAGGRRSPRRFHATLADVLAQVCERIRERTGIAAVALSGGVFQNAWLLQAAIERLDARGFEVYTSSSGAPNDGGLALGQAAVAARRLAARGNA